MVDILYIDSYNFKYKIGKKIQQTMREQQKKNVKYVEKGGDDMGQQ